MEKYIKQREQAFVAALAATPPPSPGNVNGSVKHSADESGPPLSLVAVPAQKQLKYSAGIANSPSSKNHTFNNQTLKMVPIAQLPVGKKLAVAGQSGKLWRCKRSHHQCSGEARPIMKQGPKIFSCAAAQFAEFLCLTCEKSFPSHRNHQEHTGDITCKICKQPVKVKAQHTLEYHPNLGYYSDGGQQG